MKKFFFLLLITASLQHQFCGPGNSITKKIKNSNTPIYAYTCSDGKGFWSTQDLEAQ